MLERNKYVSKFPASFSGHTKESPNVLGVTKGIEERLYDWEHGHHPISDKQADNQDQHHQHTKFPIGEVLRTKECFKVHSSHSNNIILIFNCKTSPVASFTVSKTFFIAEPTEDESKKAFLITI